MVVLVFPSLFSFQGLCFIVILVLVFSFSSLAIGSRRDIAISYCSCFVGVCCLHRYSLFLSLSLVLVLFFSMQIWCLEFPLRHGRSRLSHGQLCFVCSRVERECCGLSVPSHSAHSCRGLLQTMKSVFCTYSVVFFLMFSVHIRFFFFLFLSFFHRSCLFVCCMLFLCVVVLASTSIRNTYQILISPSAGSEFRSPKNAVDM